MNKRLLSIVTPFFVLSVLSFPGRLHGGEQTKSRFQVEIFSGFAALSPADLNSRVGYDNHVEWLLYDQYYAYLQSTNQVAFWRRQSDGERREITSALPFGIRLKYHLNRSLALSVGLRYLSQRRSDTFTVQYYQTDYQGMTFIDQLDYFPYSIKAAGFAPLLGIHVEKQLKRTLGIGAYFLAGPLFARCRYLVNWQYRWLYQGNGYNYLLYKSEGMLAEKGKGTGFVLELGGRLHAALGKKLGLFLEIGYALQRVSSISGEGRETRNGSTTTWAGDWGIIEEEIITDWGGLVWQLPTSYLENWPASQYVRDFKLDLSGFQLRIGVSYRF